MARPFVSLACSAGLICGCLLWAEPASAVLIDFSTAADMDEFVQIRGPSPSNAGLALEQSASAGTGAGPNGGVIKTDVGTNNGQNDIVAIYTPGGVYADSAVPFGVGETLTVSIKLKTGSGADANLAATPRLGIAGWTSYDAVTVGGAEFDTASNSSRFIFGGNDNNNGNNPTDSIAMSPNGGDGVAKNLQLVTTDAGNVGGRQVFSDVADDALMLEDSWYQMVLEITKLSTMDTFDASATLNLLNSDGTAVDSVIQAVSESGVVVPDMWSESAIVAGFSWTHNGAPSAMAAEMDDFELSIVPEPGAVALLAAAALGVVARRR